MANEKRKPGITGCFGIGIIVFLGTIALISQCNHKREEAKQPVISATFETISELKLGDEELVSITGYLSNSLNDGCNYPTAPRCQVDLVSEDPKNTDARVILLVKMASEGMHDRNTVLIADTGDLNIYTDDKQRLTSSDLIKVIGHITYYTYTNESHVDFYVDTIEAAP